MSIFEDDGFQKQSQKPTAPVASGPTPTSATPGKAAGPGTNIAAMSDDDVSRAYEVERKRHAVLRDRKIEMEATRKRAQADLDALRAEMQTAFGTSDVKELKVQLEQRRAERQALLTEVRQSNDAVEAALAELAQGRELA